jgi:hypothetical protein
VLRGGRPRGNPHERTATVRNEPASVPGVGWFGSAWRAMTSAVEMAGLVVAESPSPDLRGAVLLRGEAGGGFVAAAMDFSAAAVTASVRADLVRLREVEGRAGQGGVVSGDLRGDREGGRRSDGRRPQSVADGRPAAEIDDGAFKEGLMGWTSGPFDGPFNARVVLAWEFREAFLERVVASARKGSTIYAAVRSADDLSEVYGMVVLTERKRGTIWTKAMDETVGPGEDECPARILDLLTDTRSEYAREWRKRCRAQLERPLPRPGDTIVFPQSIEFNNGKSFDRLTFRGRTRLEDENGFAYRVRGWRGREYRIERPEGGEA